MSPKGNREDEVGFCVVLSTVDEFRMRVTENGAGCARITYYESST